MYVSGASNFPLSIICYGHWNCSNDVVFFVFRFICNLVDISISPNRIGSVMGSVLALSTVDRGFGPRSGQTRL
jgi:hypothetical protein